MASKEYGRKALVLYGIPNERSRKLMSLITGWGPSISFALLITGGFLLQAYASKQIEQSPSVSTSYVIALLTNPFFLLGIVLSFGSTFARQAMLVQSGANKTVLLSELSVIMMYFAALIFFNEKGGMREYFGATLIFIGTIFVGVK